MSNIVAFIGTVIIEALCILALKLFHYLEKREFEICLLISFAANVLTNIPLNLFLNKLVNIKIIYYYLIVFVCEVSILFIEALFYKIYLKNFKRSFFVSLLCNVTSFVLGIGIMYIYYYVL